MLPLNRVPVPSDRRPIEEGDRARSGSGPPTRTGATVAVKVTDCPGVDGLADEVRVVAVSSTYVSTTSEPEPPW